MICLRGLQLAVFCGLIMLTLMKMSGHQFDPTLPSMGLVPR